jgi:hypothetical protein
MDSAVMGFNDLGMKIVPFYGFGDIEADVDCGPEALVSGYIGDVRTALKKLGLPLPPELDYPKELRDFYGREIWEGTLQEAKQWPLSDGPVFVKPTTQKLFTGLVWHGTKANRLTLATYDDDTPVFMSQVVNFISEFRCYILDGKVLDVKRYKGTYSVPRRKAHRQQKRALCPSCGVDGRFEDSKIEFVWEKNSSRQPHDRPMIRELIAVP